MTPMVDLGFLLITFFIFTATMKSPATMDLNMPKETDQKDETKIKQSGALTIMLGKDNNVYYYEGELANDGSNFKTSNFKEIRKVIQDKKKDVIKNHVHDDKCEELRQKAKNRLNPDPNWQNADLDRDFVVVIKPDAEATYKNTVDILDEMTINAVKRFAMVKISESEDALIKRTEGGK